MKPLLELRRVSKAFGAVVIAERLDLSVGADEGLGIIGPNGAGKSTLFGMITGDVRPDDGQVVFDGRDVTALKPHRRCRLGIGRSYQIPHPFARMSVYENVLTAAVYGGSTSEARAVPVVRDVLGVTGMMTLANVPAGRLTLLQRKRLELARALATGPRLLLLDEIAGGLTEREVRALIATIRDVRAAGVALVWIEHIVHALIATVERLIVLDAGALIADGEPAAVMRAPQVQRIYMGVEPTGHDAPAVRAASA